MVLIPGGTLENEPLDAFWLDRDEVGLREYRQCLAAGACNESKSSHDPQSPHPDGSVIAGYAAAARYCSWRGKRLPTAREWIWAARGRDEHRTFPWGEEAPDFGRVFATDDSHDFGVFYDESTPLGPHIVVRTIEGKARRVWRHGPTARGSRPSGASRDGVRDLIGNVQEVVMLREDAYAYIGGSYRYPLPQHADIVEAGLTGEEARLLAASELLTTISLSDQRAYEIAYGPGFRCAADEAYGAATAPRELVALSGSMAMRPLGMRRFEEAQSLCEEADPTLRLPPAATLRSSRESLTELQGPFWTRSGQRWFLDGTIESEPGTPATALVLCLGDL